MHTLPSLNALDPFLSSQWHDSATPWVIESSSRPFITLSREAGSGGSSFARLLARRLNAESTDRIPWRVFEGNIVAAMLAEAGHPAWTARFLPEKKIPDYVAWLGELVGLHPNLWDLVQKTNETMRRLALEGNVILVGRGSNFATEGLSQGVHVRLVAPQEDRARYLARRYNIPEREALVHNAKCEAERCGYVKSVFGVDPRDHKAYDLVFNTAKISLDSAADMVGNLLTQRRKRR